MEAPKPTQPKTGTARILRAIWILTLSWGLGLGIAFFCYIASSALLHRWSGMWWVWKAGLWFFLAGLVPLAAAFLLKPFSGWPWVERALRIVLMPTEWLLTLAEYYSILSVAVLSFMAVYVTPMVGWKLLEYYGYAPAVPEKAYMYVALVLAAVIFTFLGSRLTARFISKRRLEKHSRLMRLLQPPYIRVYLYSMQVFAYVAANIEKFSGKTLTSAKFWSVYKDVLVEVLLTYVAIDALSSAFRQLLGSDRSV